MKNEIRAAVYARVSTHDQNATMQLRELEEYCGRRHWPIVEQFVDVGVSGKQERRPALDRMLVDCRRLRFDAVVVYRYDRFARSLRQLVNALCEFDNLGVQFVSLCEGVDTTTPNGRLVFGIFATIAEFERELICDRVRSGMAAARDRGKTFGRPRAEIDVAKVSEMRAKGVSWRQIRDRLDVSLGSAQRAFRRQTAASAVEIATGEHQGCSDSPFSGSRTHQPNGSANSQVRVRPAGRTKKK